MFLHLVILLSSLRFCVPLLNHGWHYMNIHCRSNDNAPEDWWYFIKPPGMAAPYGESGRNFSYIQSSDVNSRWKTADQSITSENMLLNTLAPIFKQTYTDHLAYIVFDTATDSDVQRSRTHAVLMADEIGGAFLIHTVPNLVDDDSLRFQFPVKEIATGHMAACVSLEHDALDYIARILKNSGATITGIHVPNVLTSVVPYWEELEETNSDEGELHSLPTFEFTTESKLLHGIIFSRKPGEDRDLFEEFAKEKSIILDVYSPESKLQNVQREKPNYCGKNDGVRNIKGIVIKTGETVQYVNPDWDKCSFAVSTAAHWQRQGGSTDQYWTCVGSVLKYDSAAMGGLLFCAENNQAWTNFDNLKVHEPKCS